MDTLEKGVNNSTALQHEVVASVAVSKETFKGMTSPVKSSE
jgi:hypothetical protein